MENDLNNPIPKDFQSIKDKSKKWLKNYYNLALIVLILAAFVLNVYYFNETKYQALWWDEAEYMSTAKHWAFGVPYEINPQRPPLFPLIGAGFLIIGLPDILFKFAFVLIPTILTILFVFLLGKKLYDERVALFSAAAFAVFWSSLFWTQRFQPDSLVLLFQLIAIYFFWETFMEKKSNRAWLFGLFTALAFMTKIQALLIIPLAFFAMLFIEKLNFLKKKETWIAAGTFILTISPYLVWNLLYHGDVLAFRAGYSDAVIGNTPFGWYVLDFISAFAKWPLLILFALGALMALYGVILGYDLLKENKKLKSDLISILTILIVQAFFIFYIRGAEDRWVMLMAPFMFFLAGNASFWIYDQIKPYNKAVAITLISILVISSGYVHLTQASNLIESKKDSYGLVREAGILIRDHSNPEDVVWTN